MTGLKFEKVKWDQRKDPQDPGLRETWFRKRDAVLDTDAQERNFKVDPTNGDIVPIDLMIGINPLINA